MINISAPRLDRLKKRTAASACDKVEVEALDRRPWILVGLVAVPLATAAAVASDAYQAVTLALYVVAGLAALAAAWPERYVATAVLLLLFPFTWSPGLGLFATVLPPFVLMTLPAGLVALAIVAVRGQLKSHMLDWLVCALILAAFVSEISAGASHDLSRDLLETLLIPYFVFRLVLTAWPQMLHRLPGVLMVVGVLLSLLAVWEVLRGSSPFAHSALTNAKLLPWAVDYSRGGGVRAAATMGHPIALGSFLLIPIVLAYSQRRWRILGICLIGEALTLSRGPYIAVTVALLLLSMVTGRMWRLGIAAAVLFMAVLLVSPIRATVTQSFERGNEAYANAAYRRELLEASLKAPTLLGNPTLEASSLYGHPGQFQLSDVTSEFALLVGREGLIGLAIWLGVLTSFGRIVAVGRRRGDPLLATLGVILVGEWVSLLSVSLITSFGYVFLLVVAMAATRASGVQLDETRPLEVRSRVGDWRVWPDPLSSVRRL